MPGYGQVFWEERTSARLRPSFKPFRGDSTADVVVIGGGLTGCLAANVLAGAGYDVVLLEAERLADGATAGGLGAVLPQPDASYRDVEALLGRKAARLAWNETQRAAAGFGRALGKLPIKRELSSASFVVNSRDTDVAAMLQKDQSGQRTAGMTAPWLQPRAAKAEIGSLSHGAIRQRGVTLHDPVRTTLALARAAKASGARIHERSPVKRTKYTRQEATVVLAAGAIETQMVFVATGSPGRLFSQLRRHVREVEGYAVATAPLTAEMRREVGRRAAVVLDPGEDPRWLRWLPNDRALFAGAPGKPVPARQPRQREKVLVQRTGQLMYEFSVRHPIISGLPAEWAWDFPVVSTPDGLPWIGPHRNYPFHFFAMAFGWHGDAMAWWAAKAAERLLDGKVRKEDDAFGFVRHL